MKNTIYSLFRQTAETYPNAVACRDECRTLSYSGLLMLADTIAAGFPKLKSGRIGLVCDHSVEMIASMLAVLKSGAAYVPVEPSFPTKRIDFVMNECKVDFIITNSVYKKNLKGFKTFVVDRGISISVTENSKDRSNPDDPAYILYTSGSTGKPKGVCVTNANVCHYVRAFRHEFHPGPGDVMLQHSVCSFDIFVEEVFTTLLSGATLAIPSDSTKKDMKRLMRFVVDNKVSIISGFPYLLLELNKLKTLPPSLRLLISGGDVLRHKYVDRLIDKIPVYNTYGPSETTVCASYQRCLEKDVLPDGTFPIGRPVQGVRIMICDEKQRPVPDGTPGEICIIGDGVSKGYVGRRKKENAAFMKLADGTRLYRSGDIGTRLKDGTLLFHHRCDSQVMILGRRVETVEVESVLCECPEVEAGVVTSNKDDKGLSYLTAYLVPKNIRKFSLKKLREKMASFLPEYMIPEFFVTLNLIPTTPNGKTDYRALPVVPKTGEI